MTPDIDVTDAVTTVTPGDTTPMPLDVLAALDADTLAKVIAAGSGLVARAGDLWDALTEIAETNTARPAIEIITDVALTAALPTP